ncbi:hypothetical protein B0H10DRAFT_2222607 [Mycena sp. CBHHK59/15]|nr:hypothetical protein B0H10DRAFT_2222607 [Mycena sp. CBHHK59/15]
MPTLFVPDDIAASLLSALSSASSALPPSFAELCTRLNRALAEQASPSLETERASQAGPPSGRSPGTRRIHVSRRPPLGMLRRPTRARSVPLESSPLWIQSEDFFNPSSRLMPQAAPIQPLVEAPAPSTPPNASQVPAASTASTATLRNSSPSSSSSSSEDEDEPLAKRAQLARNMPSLTVKLPSLAQRIASGHYKGSADEDEDDDEDEDAEYGDTGAADLADSSNTVETSVAVVNQFALNVKKNELGYMLALVQLTMNVNSLKCDSKKKNLSKPKMTEIAEKYAPDISRTTFNDWLSCGQKLTLLCAGGTLYLFPIIAALDMRTCITRQCGEEDILSIANALREVKHGQWLPLVKHLMIPIQFLHRLKGGILPKLPLFYNVPKPVGEAPETYQYHFCNIVQLDTVFDSIETNYPKLPARSLEWDSQTIPSWDSVSLLEFTAIPSNTIKTPLAFKNTPIPFKRADRDTWTERQRSVAERAEVALNLKDLEDKLNVIHAGGKRKRNSYVEVNTKILESKPLFIRDANDKLLSLVFTVPDSIRQSLEDAILHLEAAMPGEFREEDSQQEKFKYYS